MSEHQHEEPQQMESLPEPPPILILTMTTNLEGESNLRYNMPPENAVAALREVADSLEVRIQQEATEAEAEQ